MKPGTTDDRPPVNDAEAMRLWRECGLPEWFLGRAGTNYRLTEFVRRIKREARPRIMEHM